MLKAIIFDYGGVLVNDQAFERYAVTSSLDRLGIPFDPNEFDQFFGRKPIRIAASTYLTYAHRPELLEEFMALCDMYEGEYANHIEIYQDTIFFMDRMKRSYKIAIASGGRRSRIEQTLRKIKRGHIIDHITASGEFEDNKYTAALEALGIDASEALAIEDSSFGVEAAREAGVPCIAITHTHAPEELADASFVINSYDEITEEVLTQLFPAS